MAPRHDALPPQKPPAPGTAKEQKRSIWASPWMYGSDDPVVWIVAILTILAFTSAFPQGFTLSPGPITSGIISAAYTCALLSGIAPVIRWPVAAAFRAWILARTRPAAGSPAQWHNDPTRLATWRYFDGTAWTDQVFGPRIRPTRRTRRIFTFGLCSVVAVETVLALAASAH